jgi:hypothetical protein
MVYPPLSDFLDAGEEDCLSTAVIHNTFGPTRDCTENGHSVYTYKDARAIDTGGRTERVRLDVYSPSVFGEIEDICSTVRSISILARVYLD